MNHTALTVRKLVGTGTVIVGGMATGMIGAGMVILLLAVTNL